MFRWCDKVSAELESEFTELTGCVIDEGYGMTETGHATISPTDGEIRLGSIGIPCPGYEFSIRDEDGNELSTGSRDAPGCGSWETVLDIGITRRRLPGHLTENGWTRAM